MREAELYLLADNWTDGERLLHKVTADYPRSETSARGYYDLGRFLADAEKDYPGAMSY